MIDHRGTQSLPEEMVRHMGLPTGSGRGLFESATITCNHCKTVVILNPDRSRERAWCKGCDHYLCDGCGVIRQQSAGACKTFDELVDEVQKAALVADSTGERIALPDHPLSTIVLP